MPPLSARLPDALPWPELARPLVRAEDALARLDERLRTSPILDGWIARTHFSDAAATLWLEGELVHLEDLVLHDAGMDVRAPTHELTRAYTVLRARRRLAGAAPGWALSPAGLEALRGRAGEADATHPEVEDPEPVENEDEASDPSIVDDEAFSELFASVDAAIAQADRTLTSEPRPATPSGERDPLVYDLDWDEDARLAEWRAIVDQTRDLPPTLAAALVHEAWSTIEPLQRAPGLGRLLAGALLQDRGKSRAHLPCLAEGAKAVPRERRRSRDAVTRLLAELEAIAAAAEEGLKQHDRWLLARTLLLRKLDGRRSTSRLPELIELVISRPLVSAGMIAKELDITPRAAQNLVAELDLREATGRERYRAWGVL
ncbi:hypothetical protein ACVIW2_000206 [Bradyrhizobium huanghuaihaiense]|uniref:DUF1612 and helix-turn-helix domain-containing protein n=1 Tax=Bradyrhizobium barranii subsp. barranii TaxID=2823807 RepID=A0A7Z0QLT6_9BRAD|nr:RHE_PE00001 family protein [Bradyrhizobium barranii]UGX89672.1 DUF1612 and helix-turn-helix domain-containing protein [Bradyrhizobium barranii subsp. barranii]